MKGREASERRREAPALSASRKSAEASRALCCRIRQVASAHSERLTAPPVGVNVEAIAETIKDYYDFLIG